MADENRTEPSTPKKRKDTREKGEVARSLEMSAAANILAGLVATLGSLPLVYRLCREFFIETMHRIEQSSAEEFNLMLPLMHAAVQSLAAALPVLLVILVATLAVNYGQIGFKIATSAIAPKMERINPMNGWKRIFGMRGLQELLKGAVKITFSGIIVYFTLRPLLPVFEAQMGASLGLSLRTLAGLLWGLVWKLGALFLGLGVMDYAWQRYEFEKKLKMTRQEIRDEYRETEGDMLLRSRRRSQHRKWTRSRMAAEVARADVVTTNPTHYAVALRYDSRKMKAPKVVAKGQRLWAKLIVRIARKHHVPVMENKPLTRALYHSVEIGQEVPPVLYRTVAELLATLYKLRARRGIQK